MAGWMADLRGYLSFILGYRIFLGLFDGLFLRLLVELFLIIFGGAILNDGDKPLSLT